MRARTALLTAMLLGCTSTPTGPDAHCAACVAPPPGCSYVGGDGCFSCGTLVCADGAITDGGLDASADGSVDGATCECPAPPPGCRYAGACPSCGEPVCDEVMCGGGTHVFPTFDRRCAAASECALVEHQVDCCGSLRAIGVRSDQQAAFDDAEARCRAMFPACGCAPRPTEADDGTVSPDGRAASVRCVDGACTSSFGLAEGETCARGTMDCAAGLSCCYPCGIPGCENRCEPTCDPADPACADGCQLRP